MRMHSYSKCSPNLVVGALLIFSVIVLYNYWNISTLNRELIIKINTLEKQVISFSKANEGLQSGLEKVQDEKNKLQLSLQQEEMQGRDLRDRVAQKERLLKEVQSELEQTKQDAQNCHDESGARETKCQSKDKEISDLKESVTRLEAQAFEKTSIAEKCEGELSDAKSKIEDLQKELANKPTAASKSTSSDGKNNKPAPVAQPEEQGNADQEQPVLLNDPAVPYPAGWMDPKYSKKHSNPKVSVQDDNIGLRGIKGHGQPVILFDDPETPRKQARFSVLEPPQHGGPLNNQNALPQPQVVNKPEPETQMNPQVKVLSKEPVVLDEPIKQPEKVGGGEELEKDNPEQNAAKGEETDREGGGEKESPVDGAGVLPVPDSPKAQQFEKSENQQQAPQHGAQNLDAQEDDKDRKDDTQADDQSPDGALPPKDEVEKKEDKDKENVAPVPQILKQQDLSAPNIPAPAAGAHSGQVDARENAHLTNNL